MTPEGIEPKNVIYGGKRDSSGTIVVDPRGAQVILAGHFRGPGGAGPGVLAHAG